MTLTSKASRFKSKFITAELARLFSQSDSEEEFEGFSEDEEEEGRRNCNKRMKTKIMDSEEDSDVDTGFYSDGEKASPPKRRSLLVALRFPMKRLSTPKQKPQGENVKQPVKETPSSKRARGRPSMKQRRDEEEEEEEEQQEEDKEEVLYQSLRKRDKNIQENKAMLAKLFADLSTMADLTLPTTPQKKKKKQVPEKATPRKRKSEPEIGSERRNPSRKARPPENFAVEEKSEPIAHRTPRSVDVRRLMEVDEEHVGVSRKKRSSRSSTYVRSVDDITEEELDNIAYRSKDKIWDKENGSSCHQCRQKTLDTKTVCRSGFCVGVKGQFCGLCLKNRYGEDVRTVLLDPTWSCPICRGMCNCSVCRKKEGRCATGILVGLARYNGHDNVHEYLESIQKEVQESPEC
ncbi:cell division cycle-associated 7-like protein [Seriola lalandi dorsalis]|uniref:Cell division cycle associated 7 like n=1 Tax=Seriola lalandi dorsalis TaxID=1841481 RepID=A0A3B4X2J7_SERLL|nr:cell division cycle-associated 7-like protein [Seriola lalandi dorsalis]XP_056255519.1 cell division cycle-associated 7-like protein [Seriola aureovittata]